MAGPKPISLRLPAVAGMFYPGDGRQCRATAQSYLDNAVPVAPDAPSGHWLGGIVPHAGWICSGAVAGQTIAALARQSGGGEVNVVVIFGAIHTPLPIDAAALDSHQNWAVPGGDSAVAGELAARLARIGDLFRVDDRFHQREHAIEVELPLIQLAWPKATILPVEVPVVDGAWLIGQRTAREIAAAGLSAVYLASSDLTHYGSHYGFAPAGLGVAALSWAEENDKRLLRLVTEMSVDRIVPEVKARYNACGAGAIAAMMAACRQAGASRGQLLVHTNSYQTLAAVAPQAPDNAVGYASVVIG